MVIGVPKEIKTNENRVALVPAGAEAFTSRGHTVFVEKGAGAGSGFPDEAYTAVGATILATADEVWSKAEMIMKVKEPIAVEWPRMRKGQVIYTYFHFAAAEELTRAVIKSGAIAVAYETVQLPGGELPLLTPMSEVAGRMAVQEGAKYLEKHFGGSGVLLGGVPGVAPAEVAIIGGGVVGINAAKMAAGLGARTTILDISLDRLRYLDDVLPANVTTLFSNRHNILDAIRRADLVVGAVLLPGAKAPHLVKREDLKLMKPGSVIVDVAVDQGGCVETIKPTTHENPTYFVDGILHYAVANMPGGVPRTSTLALTNATLSYGLRLARDGWKKACKDDSSLKLGLNVVEGKVVYPGVAEAFGLPLATADSVLYERMPVIEFKRLPHSDGLPVPAPATAGSAGHDITSADEGVLEPGQRRIYRTGFALAIPEGWECQIRPRSGLALKHGITLPNAPATIDSDYRGELMIALINHGQERFTVIRGMRIAQLVFARVESVEWREVGELSGTGRGAGGFGSTGH